MKNGFDYIKTKNGVWKIKTSDVGNKYFECIIEGVTCTVFEGSKYWEDNKKTISSDPVDLADALVMVPQGQLPSTMDKNLLKDEEWVKSFVKNIKEKGYHYYLSAWDSRSNLNKFAELTTKGLVFLWD